jgi:hypothetical protein
MWALISARTTENRDRWRRWGVSLAVAVVLHGAVVAAVFSWRFASLSPPPAGDRGPFVIDLAPAPSRPIAAQAETAGSAAGGSVAERSRAPERSGGGGAPAAGHAAPNLADTPATGEQNGEQKAPPAEASPSVTAPRHLENAGREDSEDKRTAGSGGGSGGGGLAPAVPGGGPIDTRITVVSPFGWRAKYKAAHAGAPAPKSKAIVLVRPSKGLGVGHPADASAPGTAINAIGEHVAVGAHIEDRVRAALARAVGKNAVGSAVPNNLGGASARGGERTVVNAIGATVRFRPQLAGTVSGARAAGATALAGRAGSVRSDAPTNTLAAINGTGMTHIGSGPGVIGGATRNHSGSINGTSFRPRYQ